MRLRVLSSSQVALLGLAGVLAYVTWLTWPYLHAIVVRDAAVTSWINVTPAPIAGYTTNPLMPGERAGADGRLATITDPRADGTALARADAELVRARTRTIEQTAIVEATERALELRTTHAGDFAATFTRDVDATVAGTEKSLAALRRQLELNRREAARVALLHQDGVVAPAVLDTANASVADHERRIADLEAVLERAAERRLATKRGVFLLEDGTDGNSTLQNLSDARVRLIQAQQGLLQLRAEQRAAESVAVAAKLAYEKSRSLDIVAPPGVMLWSLLSAPGAPVQPGSPVASWVDCSVMLVDTPVSDVETALLHVGSIAHVVIEGERAVRNGTVIVTRGAAGALGAHDIAAVAKGRRPGVGQAIVKLTPTPQDVKACAIGHAAYVDFPEVSVIDLLRARLRL